MVYVLLKLWYIFYCIGLMMIKFIFDLDGTITKCETLPLLAKHFRVEQEIEEVTRETVRGNIPFIESFIQRVFILGKLPVDSIASLLGSIPLHSKVHDFIQKYKEHCVIATGNIDYWVEKLLIRLGCTAYSSEGILEDNRIVKIRTILKKENVVKEYKSQGAQVVFIGDGNNDVEAMRCADISIASGITHQPAQSVLSVAHYLVYSEDALCRQLYQLL